jgi:hypothetical protein
MFQSPDWGTRSGSDVGNWQNAQFLLIFVAFAHRKDIYKKFPK